MKAKEYYAKFRDDLIKEFKEGAGATVTTRLVHEMLDEAIKINEARGGKTYAAIEAAFREQNQKWNALASMFEKEFGYPILKRNALAAYIDRIMPEAV